MLKLHILFSKKIAEKSNDKEIIYHYSLDTLIGFAFILVEGQNMLIILVSTLRMEIHNTEL